MVCYKYIKVTYYTGLAQQVGGVMDPWLQWVILGYVFSIIAGIKIMEVFTDFLRVKSRKELLLLVCLLALSPLWVSLLIVGAILVVAGYWTFAFFWWLFGKPSL